MAKDEEALEDILEEFKEDIKELEKDLEKNPEEKEIVEFEDIEFVDNSHITNFLMNPWKRMSFVGDNPVSNLEEDLENAVDLKKEEEGENDEPINYLKKEEEDESLYKKPKMEVEYERFNPSNFQKEESDSKNSILETKKMYDSVQKMLGIDEKNERIKYVTIEDTLRKGYLEKTKFKT